MVLNLIGNKLTNIFDNVYKYAIGDTIYFTLHLFSDSYVCLLLNPPFPNDFRYFIPYFRYKKEIKILIFRYCIYANTDRTLQLVKKR